MFTSVRYDGGMGVSEMNDEDDDDNSGLASLIIYYVNLTCFCWLKIIIRCIDHTGSKLTKFTIKKMDTEVWCYNTK